MVTNLLVYRLFPSPLVVSLSVVSGRTEQLIRKTDIKGKTLLVNSNNLNSGLLKPWSPGFDLYGAFRRFRSPDLNVGTGIDYFADFPWKEYTDKSVA
jgi:hypothetical protein